MLNVGVWAWCLPPSDTCAKADVSTQPRTEGGRGFTKTPGKTQRGKRGQTLRGKITGYTNYKEKILKH